MAWWQLPVTQGWNPPSEQGVDIATPFHTPLPPPFPGKVTRTRYGPFGGEVDIAANVPGIGNVTEYLLHEDVIYVHQGDNVTADTVTGLSGGQLSGGSHPVDPQYSSGPHTEVGFWKGAPWASPSIDPTTVLGSATGYGLTSAPAAASPDINTDIKIASIPVIGDIRVPSDFIWRFSLIGLGSLLIVIGIIIMFKPAAETAAKVGLAVAAPEAAIAGAAASSAGSGSTWGPAGRPVSSTKGEYKSDSFIKGFTSGAKRTGVTKR